MKRKNPVILIDEERNELLAVIRAAVEHAHRLPRARILFKVDHGDRRAD